VSAIPARRRRRKIAAIVTSGLAAMLLPGGLAIGTTSLLNQSGGNSVTNGATLEVPITPAELLVITNSRNEVATLAIFALAPRGKGGTIISIPVGASADVAKGVASRRLADSYVTGGLAAVKTDVENLLNISIDLADDLTVDEVTTLLAPMGAQPATLSQPMFNTAADGKTVTVLNAGSLNVTSAQVAVGLASSQTGIPEATRLAQVKVLWGSVARAGVAQISSSTSEPTNTATTVSLTSVDFFSQLMDGEIDVWQLSATLITDAVRNPNNIDLYSIDEAEVLMVMASVLPSALTLTSNNIAVMLDVPFSSTSVTQEAVTRLAFLGANVVLIRHIPDVALERTVAYVNNSLARTEVEQFSSLLGSIEIKGEKNVIAGVNARIVLGNDFVAFLGSGTSSAASTTTPAEPQ